MAQGGWNHCDVGSAWWRQCPKFTPLDLAAGPHPACVPRNLLDCAGVIQFGWYN